jgi:hypothetical protein
MFDLIRYQTADGREPFTDWLNNLRDRQAKARILARIERLEAGNFGDCEPCREGVSELRVIGARATASIMPGWARPSSCYLPAVTSVRRMPISREP